MKVDELLELLESTANMLRGMTMDPAIPAHAKDAMRSRIERLESAVMRNTKHSTPPHPIGRRNG